MAQVFKSVFDDTIPSVGTFVDLVLFQEVLGVSYPRGGHPFFELGTQIKEKS